MVGAPMLTLVDPYGLKDDPEVRVIRQSMLSTADVCLKRLAFPDRQTHSVQTLIGTSYHAAAAGLYSGSSLDEAIDTAGAVFDAEVDAFGAEVDWSDIPSDEAWTLVVEMLKTYSPQVWDPSQWLVVGVEIEFWLPLALGAAHPRFGRWAAKGTIDLVLQSREDSSRYVIVDHKTAGKPWRAAKASARHNNQPAWYLYWWPEIAAQACLPEAGQVEFFFDVITYGGEFRRWPAPRSSNEVCQTIRKAYDLAELLESNAPLMPNTASSLCTPKWCKHWLICPWGETFRTA